MAKQNLDVACFDCLLLSGIHVGAVASGRVITSPALHEKARTKSESSAKFTTDTGLFSERQAGNDMLLQARQIFKERSS